MTEEKNKGNVKQKNRTNCRAKGLQGWVDQYLWSQQSSMLTGQRILCTQDTVPVIQRKQDWKEESYIEGEVSLKKKRQKKIIIHAYI